MSIKKYPIVVLLFLALIPCFAQRKRIEIPLKYSLNEICEKDSVYSLHNIDSTLRVKLLKHFPELLTNIVIIEKLEKFGLYEIGCVNSSNFISCTHRGTAYLFFFYDNKLIFFKDRLDAKYHIEEIKKCYQDGIVTEQQQTILINKIEESISNNKYWEKEKVKNEQRW